MFKKASKFFQRSNGDNNVNGANGNEDVTDIPEVYKSPYFYGRISRKASEAILTTRGKKNGSFLLRESITPMGNFSLSMIHDRKCVHYAIEKQVDGQYMILDGAKFRDPVELVQFYSENTGFVTFPKFPCNRKPNEEAVAFRGISYDDLHNHMKKVAHKMNASLLRALGPLRETMMIHVLRSMHESMPWYHGEIDRDEAISRLQASGLEDGKFIVRCRNKGESYAITMSHDGAMRHYIISVLYGETYQIDKGPSFKALIILIDHYHNKKDGLACNLFVPCCEPNQKHGDWDNYKRISYMYEEPNSVESLEEPSSPARPVRKPSDSCPPPSRLPPAPPIPMAESRQSVNREQSEETRVTGATSGTFYEELDEVEEDTGLEILGKVLSHQEAEEMENVYVDIRTSVMNLQLKPEHVTLISKLGSGQFGEVMKGTCILGHAQVPVAVKTLKNQDAEGEKEIKSEANLMKGLDHKHIVRMIGVCKADSIMLVMELAELGPLKKFLQGQKLYGMKHWHLLEIMKQICEGMQYLESKDVVHRDLATRNVLLLNEHFAKISDFGMSRMLDSETTYYLAHGQGRWPLMWYAPECLYYHKFDSKSDVWSFGITMWEIMSYAARPYTKMKVPQIIHFLESGYRMQKPKNCDQRIYQIMLSCWEFKQQRRPSFKELQRQLEPLYMEFRHLDR